EAVMRALRSSYVSGPSIRAARGFLALAAAAALACAVAAPVSAAEDDGAGTMYYLALGDSLSTGYQPDTDTDEQDVSYPDRIYAALKQKHPRLELKHFGCDGETTGTMIHGGHCEEYQDVSQLDAAVDFIDSHPGRIA